MRASVTLASALAAVLCIGWTAGTGHAANVITNGTFNTNINGWTQVSDANGTISHDAIWGGNAPGSLQFQSITSRNTIFDASVSQTLGTISPGQDVFVSLAWFKSAAGDVPSWLDIEVYLVNPDQSETLVWSHTGVPAAGGSLTGTMPVTNVGSSVTAPGTHGIRIRHYSKSGRSGSAAAGSRIDDVVVDVSGGNSPPTLTASTTTATPASILRAGANSTTLSATFNDANDPGVGAFTVTFRVREPDNSTVVNIATAAANGAQGVTIIANGGGSYTASVAWDPAATQAVGAYDLYFEVSDGAASAVDGYAANPDELTLTNQAPTLVAGNTSASPASIEAIGANPTTLSSTFADADQPGVGAFTVSFTVQQPDNTTTVNVATNATNGSQGVTIVDNGGGSYTASVNWDPADAQVTGPYDLQFTVSDGVAGATDPFASNLDELTLTDPVVNEPPVVAVGATSTSPATVFRGGTSSVTLSAVFTDADDPGIGAFTVGFSIRQPDDSTVQVVVAGAAHGTNGVTIVNNGGGSYTASVSYDPGNSLPLGPYDLSFDVSDGFDAASDGFPNNLDELTLINVPPSLTAGNTAASPSTIEPVGPNATTISATFTDLDEPGPGGFTVTFRVLEPDNATEVVIASDAANGAQGVAIVDNGSGSYTASVAWDPGDAQAIGSYDLYFRVSDGIDAATDPYASNLDELTLDVNQPPTLVAGTTFANPASISGDGAAVTTLSASFSDADIPGIGAFSVSFSVRQPDNSTVVPVVTNSGHGVNGVTITSGGGGSYTASVSFNPADGLPVGTYDLYFEVSDGANSATDGFANNPDELTLTNQPPTMTAGATSVFPTSVNRYGANTTRIAAVFSDPDIPSVGSFLVTIRVREPDDATVVSLAEGVAHGAGGVTIVANGGGSFTVRYDWDPGATQALGAYDLYFEVTDGDASAVDGFTANANELTVFEDVPNNPPVIAAGATTVSPSSVDRVGAATTEMSVTFSDDDGPGVGAFTVDLVLREPYAAGLHYAALGLQNGQGGLTITDLGGNSYRAAVNWDPPDNALVGYYDLEARVSDGSSQAVDSFSDNPSEFLVTAIGENQPPVVQADETSASPAGIPRVGPNSTTLRATFLDVDAAGAGAFTVTFKVREPDDSTEIILANDVANGTAGVSIADLGGGIYRAEISWDPADAQTAGGYDLYFAVSDGQYTSVDGFANNADELELFDGIPNQPPTTVAGNTSVSPATITRFGSEFTMLRAEFTDPDEPGFGTFTVTFSVRDASSSETVVVNAATHASQGLRVRALGGGLYDASVLWDPPVGQVTGAYDLSFTVQDAGGLTASDGYANNVDELTITATGLAGDGNLLRRSHNADGCGGPASGCHNIVDHQGQDCLVCHTPHATSNIYLVRETISTPSSGDKPVVFKTTGIGDPYNSPDPVIGDPTSGVFADDSDGVFTGVCEVCHKTTKYHRNDGTQPVTGHRNAEGCPGCHPHAEGFPRPLGDPESSGGQTCSCHSAIGGGLTAPDGAYHHLLSSMSADYTPSAKTCLMCHVDHNIFRPDINTGVGSRGSNLRVDTTTPVVPGDSSVLANSDYLPTGAGGVCLSCHVTAQTKGYPQPDGTTQTIVIDKTEFGAATSSHNYGVPTVFTKDSSTFNANCVKCHDDNTATSYQEAGRSFATHTSPYRRMLNSFNTASPSDPLEEKHCFGCHSTTSNPNAGSNQDYFATKTMSNQALALQTVLGYAYAHPVTTYSGRHKPNETAADLAAGSTRHAECVDCHNVHAARAGVHDGSSSLVSNPLKGTWGVQPTWDPVLPVPTNNANVYSTVTGYTRVEPATSEYQICLKCHSDYTTLPAGARNLAQEINPAYRSNHGIAAPGTNAYCNPTTMLEPWASSGVAWCSDCHRSNNPADPAGPHGSNLEHLLVATVVSNNTVGTPLCYVCHLETVYWSGSPTGSKYGKHPPAQTNHKRPQGCFACHMWEYSSTPGLGENSVDDLAAGTIFVHGMNKKHVFNDQDGSAGSGELVDAFVSGYIANISYTSQNCWAQVCKNHSGQSY